MDRNSLCVCGSGKKFKKCCLKKHEIEQNFLSKIEIINSWENEDYIEVDFFYDWIPYHLTLEKVDIGLDMPLSAPMLASFYDPEDDLINVYHHAIYETENFKAFQIDIDGVEEKFLRLPENNHNGICPFCQKNIIEVGENIDSCFAFKMDYMILILKKLHDLVYN